MHAQAIRQDTSVRFRQLSRKGYSAFCSLKKCVTIGRLDKALIETSQRKQPEIIADCTTVTRLFGEHADEEDDLPLRPHPSLWQTEVLPTAEPCRLPSPQQAGEAALRILKIQPALAGEYAHQRMFPGFFMPGQKNIYHAERHQEQSITR